MLAARIYAFHDDDVNVETDPCTIRRRACALALACALLSLPVLLRAQTPAPSFAHETIGFANGDLRLAGELYRPAGTGPFPTLLYNHGSAPGMTNGEAIERLGPFFAERGWAFFAPYRRGQGLSAAAGPYVRDEIEAARATGARRALPVIAGASLATLALLLVVSRRRRVWLRVALAAAVLGAGATAYRLAGNDAGAVAMIETLADGHLSDHRAAYAWLQGQSFVDVNRVATAGNSFGGIVTLLAAASIDYCAAIDAAGAAQSWSASTELRRRLSQAARSARAPVLFFQAANDYSTQPSEILSREVTNAGTASERILYPAFGDSAEDGHAFAWAGAAVWGDDVLRFLGRHCSAELVTKAAPFAVYSAFWPNLHHVLYSEAWRRRPTAENRLAALLPEPLAAELTDGEKSAWDAAVELYERRIADRHLLFGLAETRQALAGAGMEEPVFLPDPQHLDVLRAAAPVYRAHSWAAHDAANRAWIAAAMPRVAALSPEVPERLARLYRVPWFERDVRVDIVRVASVEGAYTALEPAPAHITISSSEPNNQGWSAAEIVFHEASHALVGPVRETIGFRGPRTADLWHAALFYLTGEVVRQALASRGIEYQPLLSSTGLLDRAWPGFRAPLEAHWQRYVDGEISLEDAVSAMHADLGVPGAEP